MIHVDVPGASAVRPVASHLPAAVVATCAVILAGCSGGDPAAPRELTFGHVGEPGSLFALSAEEFARRANARLPEGFEVVVYGSSQLGGDDQLLQKIRLGTVDFALPSTIMSSRIDAFGLFEMPYLVRDRAHMRAIEEAVVWPELAPLAEAAGFRVLAVWENGFRHVTNNRAPVETPDDLDGLKLRTPRGVWRVKLFQALGANPTPMALSEVFIALQTGVIDGQENPLAQIWGSRLYEVQEFLSMTGHVYTPAYVVVSPQRFGGLPAEVQAILEEEARATQEFVHATAARLDEELRTEIEAAGVAVNEPDRGAFEAASRSVYDEFAETVGEGGPLLERARGAGGGG